LREISGEPYNYYNVSVLIFPKVYSSFGINQRAPKLAKLNVMNPDRPRLMRVLLIQGITMEPTELTPRQTLKPSLLTFDG
jgi:hypothetical protein